VAQKAKVDNIDQVFSVAQRADVDAIDQVFTAAQKADVDAIDQVFTAAQKLDVDAIDQVFTAAQKADVDAIDQVFTSTQAGNITDNNAKLTYDDAALVSNHATLHTAHTASLALKQAKLDGTQLHMDSGGTNVGIGTNSPDDELHVLGDNPVLKLQSNNPSSAGLAKHFSMGFDSGGNDTMVFSYNPNKSMLFKTSAGNIQLDINDTRVNVRKDLQVDGAVVSFANLPTSDPAVAGQLWDDNGTLMISQ
jgi:hypothetical protein